MVGVAVLWLLVGVVVGAWGAVKFAVYYVQTGPVESVRKLLWQLAELFALRPERPGDRQFHCTNAKCSCYGMEQCPICGAHYDLGDDDEADDEDTAAPGSSRDAAVEEGVDP